MLSHFRSSALATREYSGTSASRTLATREYSVIQPHGTLGAREYSLFPVLRALRTCEYSIALALGAVGTLGTREYSPTPAPRTLGTHSLVLGSFQLYLVPSRLANIQSFQPLMLLGLANTHPLELPVPLELESTRSFILFFAGGFMVLKKSIIVVWIFDYWAMFFCGHH